jgi:hypothetical protein
VSRHHINSFAEAEGDAATGQLVSAPLTLTGEKMVLRVGGNQDEERLRVSLVIDGERIFSETGWDSEHLSRREWPIGAYRGKLARLEIIDDTVFGHIVVDEIIQWKSAQHAQRF